MKLNHVFCCFLSAAMLVAVCTSSALSNSGDGTSRLNPVPDKITGFIGQGHSLLDSHHIHSISGVTEIRNKKKHLSLRVTGVYNAMTFYFKECGGTGQFPVVEFDPMLDLLSGECLGQIVKIKPAVISPGAVNMITPFCPSEEKLRVFELDLNFKASEDGYTERVYFPLINFSDGSIMLDVAWNDGVWTYTWGRSSGYAETLAVETVELPAASHSIVDSVPVRIVGMLGDGPNPEPGTNLNKIREIHGITDIRKDEKLCLRVTGVYDAMACKAKKSGMRHIPAVRFTPFLNTSVRADIEPLAIYPGGLPMAAPDCPDKQKWHPFELDLVFENPEEGYQKTIKFDVLQMDGIGSVTLMVTWNNGVWTYFYTL